MRFQATSNGPLTKLLSLTPLLLRINEAHDEADVYDRMRVRSAYSLCES